MTLLVLLLCLSSFNRVANSRRTLIFFVSAVAQIRRLRAERLVVNTPIFTTPLNLILLFETFSYRTIPMSEIAYAITCPGRKLRRHYDKEKMDVL